MTFEFLDDDYTVLDRSILQMYAECPAQARLSETHPWSMPAIAESGVEIHRAISRIITIYIESQGVLSPNDLRNEIETELWESRTDLQPEVINGFKYSIYKFAEYLTGLHFQNILRYDGGEGELSGQLSWESGQLSWDFETLKARVTSELDLLHATESPSLLAEIDWKTGRKKFTEQTVRESFQFQLHAFLVLMNYPDAEAVRISVWNTRFNLVSWAVEFRRSDLGPICTRIQMAIQNWWENRLKPIEDVPAWPVREKCRICDYALHCPAADAEIKEVHYDPKEWVKRMIVVKKRLKEMEDLAKSYVEVNGDIRTDDGDIYGFEKPKTTKRVASFYRTKKEDEDEEGK